MKIINELDLTKRIKTINFKDLGLANSWDPTDLMQYSEGKKKYVLENGKFRIFKKKENNSTKKIFYFNDEDYKQATMLLDRAIRFIKKGQEIMEEIKNLSHK